MELSWDISTHLARYLYTPKIRGEIRTEALIRIGALMEKWPYNYSSFILPRLSIHTVTILSRGSTVSEVPGRSMNELNVKRTQKVWRSQREVYIKGVLSLNVRSVVHGRLVGGLRGNSSNRSTQCTDQIETSSRAYPGVLTQCQCAQGTEIGHYIVVLLGGKIWNHMEGVGSYSSWFWGYVSDRNHRGDLFFCEICSAFEGEYVV